MIFILFSFFRPIPITIDSLLLFNKAVKVRTVAKLPNMNDYAVGDKLTLIAIGKCEVQMAVFEFRSLYLGDQSGIEDPQGVTASSQSLNLDHQF
jgi:hypothetical protein